MRYINVFCDAAGDFHYSNEEFTRQTQGLSDFEAAAQDAYRHAVLGPWRYVCTLKQEPYATAEMQERLRYLEQARFIVEMHGGIAQDYDADEIEMAAFSL